MIRLFNYFLILLSKIKTVLYNLRSDISLGNHSIVYYKSSLIIRGGSIFIGNNCSIGHSRYGFHCGMPFYTTLLADRPGANIKIGNNCRINGAYIHAWKSITIGDNCVISGGVNIIDANGHITHSYDRTKGQDTALDIIIGNNVWIGLNAIILKGSVIGDNCIVSAGSVVKGFYSPNTIISNHVAKEVAKVKTE